MKINCFQAIFMESGSAPYPCSHGRANQVNGLSSASGDLFTRLRRVSPSAFSQKGQRSGPRLLSGPFSGPPNNRFSARFLFCGFCFYPSDYWKSVSQSDDSAIHSTRRRLIIKKTLPPRDRLLKLFVDFLLGDPLKTNKGSQTISANKVQSRGKKRIII